MIYTYDNADRIESATDWAARMARFRYDAQSRLWKIELHNGTQRVFTYDSAGRVAGVRDEVAIGGALVSQFTLGHDSLDRIIEEATLPEPAQFAVTSASMAYDDDDRLTAWNALTTASDADGNLTRGPLNGALAASAYDARNRLTSVGNSTFTFDAEDRRTSRTVSGVKTILVHDPNAALSRLLQSTNGGTTTRYVYAGSLLLYAETGTTLRVHHYDYRGSTVALTDGTGAVLGRITYGSYGEIVARTGDTATEFLYNGRDGVVTDPNGLYHMRARYYSPETRRFLNADPIGFAAGTNWYAYVGGAPVMGVDPTGLDWIDNTANFIVGMGDSLSFGITRAIRDNISFYDGTVDYDSRSYFAGEVIETGIEMGLTLGAAALKKGATRAASELGQAGLKAVRKEAREVAEVAVRQTNEAGERLFVHHTNPLLGHPGGAPTLFPTLGLDAFRNSKLNLEILTHAEHIGVHRSLRFQEELFGKFVMNPILTGLRAGRNSGMFFFDQEYGDCPK